MLSGSDSKDRTRGRERPTEDPRTARPPPRSTRVATVYRATSPRAAHEVLYARPAAVARRRGCRPGGRQRGRRRSGGPTCPPRLTLTACWSGYATRRQTRRASEPTCALSRTAPPGRCRRCVRRPRTVARWCSAAVTASPSPAGSPQRPRQVASRSGSAGTAAAWASPASSPPGGRAPPRRCLLAAGRPIAWSRTTAPASPLRGGGRQVPVKPLPQAAKSTRDRGLTCPQGSDHCSVGGFGVASALPLPFLFHDTPSRSACVRRSVMCASSRSRILGCPSGSEWPGSADWQLGPRGSTTRYARASSSGQHSGIRLRAVIESSAGKRGDIRRVDFGV